MLRKDDMTLNLHFFFLTCLNCARNTCHLIGNNVAKLNGVTGRQKTSKYSPFRWKHTTFNFESETT